MPTEIEIIFPLAIYPLLFYTWGPRIARSPLYILVGRKIEKCSLISKIDKIGRRKHIERITAPSGIAVGSRINIKTTGFSWQQHLRISVKRRQNRVSIHLNHYAIGFYLTAIGKRVSNRSTRKVLRTNRTYLCSCRHPKLRIETRNIGFASNRNKYSIGSNL